MSRAGRLRLLGNLLFLLAERRRVPLGLTLFGLRREPFVSWVCQTQSGAEADVVIRIGTGIVAIQVEDTVVGTVVPVTATIGEPLI